MMAFRPSQGRGQGDHGGLQSAHSFSFAEYRKCWCSSSPPDRPQHLLGKTSMAATRTPDFAEGSVATQWS